MSKKLATLYDFQQYCNEYESCINCPFYSEKENKNKCSAFLNDIDELNDFILAHKKMKQKESKNGYEHRSI